MEKTVHDVARKVYTNTCEYRFVGRACRTSLRPFQVTPLMMDGKPHVALTVHPAV